MFFFSFFFSIFVWEHNYSIILVFSWDWQFERDFDAFCVTFFFGPIGMINMYTLIDSCNPTICFKHKSRQKCLTFERAIVIWSAFVLLSVRVFFFSNFIFETNIKSILMMLCRWVCLFHFRIIFWLRVCTLHNACDCVYGVSVLLLLLFSTFFWQNSSDSIWYAYTAVNSSVNIESRY